MFRRFLNVLVAGISVATCGALDFEIPFYNPNSGIVTNCSFNTTNPPLGQRALRGGGATKAGEKFSSRILSPTVVPATNAPAVRITSPTTNDMIFVGDHVKTVVEVSDRDNNLLSLSIDRGVNQGLTFDPPPTGTNKYTFDWIADRRGLASLTAIARDGAGLKNASTLQLSILDPSQFVRRYLPTSYTRGKAFQVRLTAKPGTNIHAWAVEEHPPQGWAVQPETWEGVYNASNNVIKWGPFMDLQIRDLTYWVFPKTNSTGPKDFSGQVSANGASTQIVGDFRILDVLPFHPADVSRDYRIAVNELTAYAAAWAMASTWSNGPVPIPVDYVTRAGQIWRMNELYTFNPKLFAPLCWVPRQQTSLAVAALATSSEVTRNLAILFTPGLVTAVTISVHPAADVESYAIEEHTPGGWKIQSMEGELGADGVLRFGPFFDARARTFTYQAIPTMGATLGSFDGVASFDGASQPIGGAFEMNVPTCVAENRDGHVYLRFNANSGQQYILESASVIGQVNWKAEATVIGSESAIDLPAIEPTETQRFYRLRPAIP
ncbi:MAG: hypothetical protein ACXWIU_11860 [Limisphaerales bacterium]